MKTYLLILSVLASTQLWSSQSIKIAAPSQFGKRPDTKVFFPKIMNDKTPLIILLHGHVATGPIQNIYMGLGNKVDEKNFILATPTGIKDTQNHHFWNDQLFELSALKGHASSKDQPQVDDIGFMNFLIEQINSKHAIDFSQIYLVGHSNGGFMAYQYACNGKYPVKAVAVLAGGISKNLKCDRQFSVMHIHGTGDKVIQYDGTPFYYSVDANLKYWLSLNQCDTKPSITAKKDLTIRFGDETTFFEWNDCKSQKRIQLWKIEDGYHIPFIKRRFRNEVIGFFKNL